MTSAFVLRTPFGISELYETSFQHKVIKWRGTKYKSFFFHIGIVCLLPPKNGYLVENSRMDSSMAVKFSRNVPMR